MRTKAVTLPVLLAIIFSVLHNMFVILFTFVISFIKCYGVNLFTVFITILVFAAIYVLFFVSGKLSRRLIDDVFDAD